MIVDINTSNHSSTIIDKYNKKGLQHQHQHQDRHQSQHFQSMHFPVCFLICFQHFPGPEAGKMHRKRVALEEHWEVLEPQRLGTGGTRCWVVGCGSFCGYIGKELLNTTKGFIPFDIIIVSFIWYWYCYPSLVLYIYTYYTYHQEGFNKDRQNENKPGGSEGFFEWSWY